ncbi:hypothetical protein [Winogradskyella schleiferi]|uniref:hypothetical protein n=1 Tax=Winogradskyella schleiferi TaxID=2686078 RepID=UPI0015C09B7E|nr:hypothetical protein [Winogradskyella schleiferi]
MIKDNRNSYNANFSEEKYQAFLEDINSSFNYKVPFKIAETPVFISKALKAKLKEACEEIMAVIDRPDFKDLTKDAFFDANTIVPNEDERPKFIQLDFGICKNENGELTPKLIELQGFPSLFFFQDFVGNKYRKHFSDVIPKHYSQHLTGMSSKEYIELLTQEMIGDTDPKQVILLEVEPHKQATAIDFYITEATLGLKIICITELIKKGKQLFYKDENGNEVRILKIYNRIIFDELHQRQDLTGQFKFQDEVDVEWIGHPNWFFRISKYLMPFLEGKYIPKSYHLDKLEAIPSDLENYVLKPLYSFAGAGVHIHVTEEIIESISNKWNYLLQEKVAYAPVIDTMDVPAKCEIRMMMMYNSKTNKTEIISNLMRLSKGEMVGVKYNKDKTWVGGSTGFFEP